MSDIEHYRWRTQVIDEKLAGGKDASGGALQKIQDAKATNETITGIHERFIASIENTVALGRQLLDAVGLTGDQLSRAQKLTKEAQVHGNIIFDTSNTSGLLQILRDSNAGIERLDKLNGNLYLELDGLLRPLSVACRNMQDLPNPAISEGEFDQIATTITEAHQGVVDYGQRLG